MGERECRPDAYCSSCAADIMAKARNPLFGGRQKKFSGRSHLNQVQGGICICRAAGIRPGGSMYEGLRETPEGLAEIVPAIYVL